MTFFEFINQVIIIIKNLTISFWIGVIIISPIFMWFEEIIQTLITKILFLVFVRFPKRYNSLQKILGFNDGEKYLELQELHDPYEKKKTISEKLKISEDFLDETRGSMFAYNELSNIILGKVVDDSLKGIKTDDNYFDYDLIYKQDYSIKELKELNNSKILITKEEGNRLFKISKIFIVKGVLDVPPIYILPILDAYIRCLFSLGVWPIFLRGVAYFHIVVR